VPKLREKGLEDYAYVYGFDEVSAEYFDAIRDVFEAIHRRFPDLRTMTTGYDYSWGRETGLRDAVDIWVPLTPYYDRAAAEKLRKEGKDMWWYVCVSPHHPYANWFIEYPAIEARLLTGAMSHKYDVGGFLYYQITRWLVNHKPIDSGPYTSWDPGSFTNRRDKTANGDGSLLCAGPDGPLSTIRLENIRDGFEDYEYLFLLDQLVQSARKHPATPERKRFLTRAEALLAVPENVVKDVSSYTRNPQALYTFRNNVAHAILEGRGLAADTE